MFHDSRSFPLSLTNICIMATPVSSIGCVCPSAINNFFNEAKESKEVALGFIDAHKS